MQIYYVNIMRREMIMIKHTRSCIWATPFNAVFTWSDAESFLSGERCERSKRQLYLPSSHTYLHKDASGGGKSTIWICCYRLKREINYVIFSPSHIYFMFAFFPRFTNERGMTKVDANKIDDGWWWGIFLLCVKWLRWEFRIR